MGMSDYKITKEQVKETSKKVLSSIERDREREIIVRRFGLDGTKETLEQVGDSMGITRERVRQIEKATLIRAKLSLDDGKNPDYDAVEREMVRALVDLGRAGKSDDLTVAMFGECDHDMRSALVFFAELSGKMIVSTENDKFFQGIVLSTDEDDRNIKSASEKIVKAMKAHGKPLTVDELFNLIPGYEHPNEVKGIASLSKKVAHLRGLWGLTNWPEVNPKNIRDKVMVIMSDHGKPMHFSEIADAIAKSSFKRNTVTRQAIHNELIKDSRFILVGRGLYGLEQWGYKKGTLTEIITKILKEEGAPLHREEIIRRVLKQRHIREATILLTLQNNKSFKRVSKAQYDLNIEA